MEATVALIGELWDVAGTWARSDGDVILIAIADEVNNFRHRTGDTAGGGQPRHPRRRAKF
jgi:hypothetical protein